MNNYYLDDIIPEGFLEQLHASSGNVLTEKLKQLCDFILEGLGTNYEKPLAEFRDKQFSQNLYNTLLSIAEKVTDSDDRSIIINCLLFTTLCGKAMPFVDMWLGDIVKKLKKERALVHTFMVAMDNAKINKRKFVPNHIKIDLNSFPKDGDEQHIIANWYLNYLNNEKT